MIKTPNLIRRYMFENNGTDFTGNTDATIYSSSYVDGIFGKAIHFSGSTSSYAQFTPWVFNVGCSISMWIDLSTISGNSYFIGGTRRPVTTYYPGISYNSTAQRFLVFTGDIATGMTYVYFNQPSGFVHLTIIRRTSRDYDFYVNGELIGTSNSNGDSAINVYLLGRRADNLVANCSMDEVCFWNAPLSVQNIRRVMMGLHPING